MGGTEWEFCNLCLEHDIMTRPVSYNDDGEPVCEYHADDWMDSVYGGWPE